MLSGRLCRATGLAASAMTRGIGLTARSVACVEPRGGPNVRDVLEQGNRLPKSMLRAHRTTMKSRARSRLWSLLTKPCARRARRRQQGPFSNKLTVSRSGSSLLPKTQHRRLCRRSNLCKAEATQVKGEKARVRFVKNRCRAYQCLCGRARGNRAAYPRKAVSGNRESLAEIV